MAHRLSGVRHRSVFSPAVTTSSGNTSNTGGSSSTSSSNRSSSGGSGDASSGGNSNTNDNIGSGYPGKSQDTTRLAPVPDARMHRVGALSWLVGFRIAVLSAVAVATLAGDSPVLVVCDIYPLITTSHHFNYQLL